MTFLVSLKSIVPLVNLIPIGSFPRRLLLKQKTVSFFFILFVGRKLGLLGAKRIGTNFNGNALLRLNKVSALGYKGTIIEVPKDQVIYRQISRFGSWELQESKFIANGLLYACNNLKAKTALLDIGAHVGLVTLQAMNLAKTSNDIFLFEPMPNHIYALKSNLSKLSNINLRYNNFALSNRNGWSPIYTQTSNRGNSSLVDRVVPSTSRIETQIQLVDNAEYCHNHLNGYEAFVLKSDTQGMDPLILSNIPEIIWEKIICAVIEVWAIPEIKNTDVDTLLSMLGKFSYTSWNFESGNFVSKKNIRDFWLSKTNLQRNLFLRRN